MPLTKIEKWVTSDHLEFDKEIDAEHHEQHIELLKRIRIVLESFHYDGMTANELVEFLADPSIKESLRQAYGL